MLVQITLDAADLARPGVAAVLARLSLALGGAADTTVSVQRVSTGAKERRERLRAEESTSWVAFEASLSERQRAFLTALAIRKEMDVATALKVCRVGMKGIGGITGTMGRKAKNRGLGLPFERVYDRTRLKGWKWTGTTAPPGRRLVPGTEVEDLDFSVRTMVVLEKMRIRTLGQLVLESETSLLKHGMTRKCLNEVREFLLKEGYGPGTGSAA